MSTASTTSQLPTDSRQEEPAPFSRKGWRPIIDFHEPTGFSRYPYYTVREVAMILSLSDDLVRKLFRNGKQGPVLEICNARPGKRTYRTLLIPYATLIGFIGRFTRDRSSSRSDRRGHLP